MVLVDAAALGASGRSRAMAAGGLAGDLGGASGAIGSGGSSEVVVRLESGLRAEIVRQSVEGARVRVAQDLATTSDISTAARRLQQL
jgi:hypothetical protein